jgi:hypothetical protein
MRGIGVSPKTLWPMCAVMIIFLSFGGCSKDEITKLADQVKEATVEKIDQLEKVAPILPKTGEIQLTIDVPTQSRTGYASLVQVETGRPSVLQIRSYVDPARETFPAIFFQGLVPADSAASLAGKTVTGRLFIQSTAGAPVWFNEDNSSVQLTIQSLEETEIVGSFSAGTLTNSDGKSSSFSGSFRAVLDEASLSGSTVTKAASLSMPSPQQGALR